MLEARVAHVEEDLKEVKSDVKVLREGVSYIRGRIENLPSTWVLITTITASQAALLGFTFAMLRFLMPHL